MAFFPKPARPRTAWEDIKSFAGRRDRHHWIALIGAIAMPARIIYLFWLDGRTNIYSEEPVLIYAESWPLTRGAEEIRARQVELALEENERRALKREQFQRLAERLGVEYDREEAARQQAITEEGRARLGDAEEAAPVSE